MADQLMFGGSDKPSSSFKLNWAFGWPGENAHAGVFVPVSQTWSFELRKADAVGIILEKDILALALIRQSSKLKSWGAVT